MISSSKLELAQQCQGAFTLPWRDESTTWSEAGTARHAEDEHAINAGSPPAEYEERWPGLTWRAEVSYAYDIASGTSRYLGCGINRAYGDLTPFEVPGTIDAEGRGPGVLVVVDRKGFEQQTPAAAHPQARFLALCAARHQAAEQVTVAIRPEVGGMDVAELDPVLDLDIIAHDVRELVIRMATLRADVRAGRATPRFTTGRWCRWCPAFDECPEQRGLRALMRRDEDDPELALSTFVDDDSAAEVYQLWKRIGILHKRLSQQLHAHAASRPIFLPGGRVFGYREKQGSERLSGDVAYEVVRELHGQALADAAVERVATKTGLERALKGDGGPLAPRLRAVLDKIRKRGGATRSSSRSIEEYDAGPKELKP